MTLQKELKLRHPFHNLAHEALIAIIFTGNLLAKEGYQILRPFGLTDTQFNVLMLLKYQAEDGVMSQTDLCNRLFVNRSNVTGLIDRMQQNNWVKRMPHPDDRRINLVEITEEGTTLLEQAEKIYTDRVLETMADISSDEAKTLRTILQKIRTKLQK